MDCLVTYLCHFNLLRNCQAVFSKVAIPFCVFTVMCESPIFSSSLTSLGDVSILLLNFSNSFGMCYVPFVSEVYSCGNSWGWTSFHAIICHLDTFVKYLLVSVVHFKGTVYIIDLYIYLYIQNTSQIYTL